MLPGGPARVPQNKGGAGALAAGGPGRADATPASALTSPPSPQLTSLHSIRCWAGRAGPGHLASMSRLHPERSLQSHGEGGTHLAGPQTLSRPLGCRGGPGEPRGGLPLPGNLLASAPGTDLIRLPAASPPSAHGHGPPRPVPRGGPRAGDQCPPTGRMPASPVAPAPPRQLDKGFAGCDAPLFWSSDRRGRERGGQGPSVWSWAGKTRPSPGR